MLMCTALMFIWSYVPEGLEKQYARTKMASKRDKRENGADALAVQSNVPHYTVSHRCYVDCR